MAQVDGVQRGLLSTTKTYLLQDDKILRNESQIIPANQKFS